MTDVNELHGFDWRDVEDVDSLRDRFPPGTFGRAEWQNLVENVGADADAWRRFDIFLEATNRLPPVHLPPRLFVSHQRRNVDFAERVANLACEEGFYYRLDVHDPTLAGVNALPAAHPLKSVLLAAVIEMALLNSTHVIAVHTEESLTS